MLWFAKELVSTSFSAQSWKLNLILTFVCISQKEVDIKNWKSRIRSLWKWYHIPIIMTFHPPLLRIGYQYCSCISKHGNVDWYKRRFHRCSPCSSCRARTFDERDGVACVTTWIREGVTDDRWHTGVLVNCPLWYTRKIHYDVCTDIPNGTSAWRVRMHSLNSLPWVVRSFLQINSERELLRSKIRAREEKCGCRVSNQV